MHVEIECTCEELWQRDLRVSVVGLVGEMGESSWCEWEEGYLVWIFSKLYSVRVHHGMWRKMWSYGCGSVFVCTALCEHTAR